MIYLTDYNKCHLMFFKIIINLICLSNFMMCQMCGFVLYHWTCFKKPTPKTTPYISLCVSYF